MPRDWVGVTDKAARMPLVGSSRLVVLSYFRLAGIADQVILPGDALLNDRLLLARQAKAGGPMRRQLAVERDFLQQRVLVIGLQALVDRIQIHFQRLVTHQEIGLEELGTSRVAGPVTASPPNWFAGRQVQLFRVAEQIAIVPGGG